MSNKYEINMNNMKLYKKDDKIKPANKIIIIINGQQVLNPTEEMLISDGWVEYVYVAPEPTEEELFNRELNMAINNIEMYDSSNNVNIFYINNNPIWLDKSTRVGLMLRFNSEKAIGRENTALWHKDIKYDLNLDDAISMLTAIEIYASACYDNTQFHIAQIKQLDTIDDIKNYDYTIGYPEILKFNN